MKVSYKLIHSLLMDMIKRSQNTQRSKFAISLQYPKIGVRDVEHQFLQVGSIAFD